MGFYHLHHAAAVAEGVLLGGRKAVVSGGVAEAVDGGRTRREHQGGFSFGMDQLGFGHWAVFADSVGEKGRDV